MAAVEDVRPAPISTSGAPMIGRARALPSRLLVLSSATMAALILAQIVLIVTRLQGHFVYTLDDPYIHLSLAAQIAHGHYGLHPGEVSAPSSSILYPFLLAPLELIGFGAWAPMVINALAAVINVSIIALIVDTSFPEADRAPSPVIVLAVCLAATGLNLVGVAMTGMEHGLQITLTLTWLLGATRFLRRGEVHWWWCASATLAPFVRYEAGTLWLAAIVLLLSGRRYRSALSILAVGGIGLAAFSLFLHLHGLAWLPSSVLVKAGQTGSEAALVEAGPAMHVFRNVLDNVLDEQGRILVVAMLALALIAVRKRRSGDADRREVQALCLAGLWVSSAQILAGHVDGFSRYAIYVSTLDAAIIATSLAPEIRRFMRSESRASAWIASAGAASLLLLCQTNVHRSVRSDIAARNIYEQQYQMHRLAAEIFRAPVAVNDLGLVSFENPYPVQDLWGLGSEEARLARSGDPSGRWMASFVDRHDVGLAMIYDRWFKRVPREWIARAALRLGGDRESAGSDMVSIYATGPERVARVDAALDAWGAGLPAGVELLRGSALRAVPTEGR